jgi:hypothetical protein
MSSVNSDGVSVRHVLSGEHDLLRKLRLVSLAADPEAFASTYELGAIARRACCVRRVRDGQPSAVAVS